MAKAATQDRPKHPNKVHVRERGASHARCTPSRTWGPKIRRRAESTDPTRRTAAQLSRIRYLQPPRPSWTVPNNGLASTRSEQRRERSKVLAFLKNDHNNCIGDLSRLKKWNLRSKTRLETCCWSGVASVGGSLQAGACDGAPRKSSLLLGSGVLCCHEGPFPAAIALEFLGRLLHNTKPIQAARAFPASHPHPNLWGTAGFALSSPLSRFPAHSDILQHQATAQFFKIKARIIILHSRAVL